MVRVSNRSRDLNREKERKLRRILRGTLRKLLGRVNAELSVLVVDVDEMQELNRTYAGTDSPTDVLAFPQLERDEIERLLNGGNAGTEPLGDIVICYPIARENAARLGASEEDEIELLAVHGILHLLGYEDRTEEGRMKMEEMEKKILGKRNTAVKTLGE